MVLASELKRMRMNIIYNSILKVSKAKLKVDKEMLISECNLNWGTSRRTILEYIQDLINSGKVSERGGFLTTTKEETDKAQEREVGKYLTDFLPKENENDKRN